MDKYTDVLDRTFYAGTVGTSGAGGAYNRQQINIQQYWFDAMLEGKNTLTDDLEN